MIYQSLSPYTEAPLHHFVSAEPSLGVAQTDFSSLHCSDTRKGMLLDNAVTGNSVPSEVLYLPLQETLVLIS